MLVAWAGHDYTLVAVREGGSRCCKQQLAVVRLGFSVDVSEQRVIVDDIPTNCAITAIVAMLVDTMKAGTREHVRGGTS